MNITMEEFYAKAKDADILIYNSTIEGEMDTLSELLEKDALFADFDAVKAHEVYCTEKDMFQEITGAAEMIEDLTRIISGSASAEGQDTLQFIHRLR